MVQDLSIGGDDSGPADLFDMRGLAVDGTGRIYLIDYPRAVIQVFDSTGAHVRTIGRRRGGPGEFEDLIGMGIHGSTHGTIDQGNVLVSLFDTSGTLRSTHPRHNLAGNNVGEWEGGIDTAGTIIEMLGVQAAGLPFAGISARSAFRCRSASCT